MSTADSVRIFEVGPRDGLQNEKTILSLEDKLWLIESLSKAGVNDLEAGAFVRPDKVLQMADSDQIEAKLRGKIENQSRYYLVPNQKGFDRAVESGVTNIAVFTAVSDSFNKKNIGMSVADSLIEIESLVKQSKSKGFKVRGYVSTVWGCPFEGRVNSKDALKVLHQMLALPVDEVSIGDTIGVAAPRGVQDIFEPLQKSGFAHRIAGHFHDTRGTALANTLRAYEFGVRTFDSSLGGLGGCPFAPGASGNLATEDLAYLFKEMGIRTGVDYSKLCQTSLELSLKMGRTLSSRALRAFETNCTQANAWDS